MRILIGSKSIIHQSRNLFRLRLAAHTSPEHELLLKGDAMQWLEFKRCLYSHFVSTTGKPVVAKRLYLQYACDCSDKNAGNTWVENGHRQFLIGET